MLVWIGSESDVVLMGIDSGPFRKKLYPTRRAGKVLMKITDTEPIARS